MKKFLPVLLLLLLVGCAKPSPTVMTVDGFAISQDLYAYYFHALSAEYEDEATVRAETVELLRSHVVIFRFAEQHGIALTEEEEAEVDAQIQSAKGRNDDFAEQLAEQSITEDLYRELCLHDALRQKLMEALHAGDYAVTEDQMRPIIEEEFLCVRHIYLDASVANADKAAAEIADLAAGGYDFEQLMTEYMGQEYSTESLLFGKGYMVEEFDAAARALAIGQVSGPVQTGYGWHVIQRLPLDWAYIEENLDTITEEYVQTRIATDMAAAAETYEIVYLQ